MKKALLILTIALLTVIGSGSNAFAGHSHYRGCGHHGYRGHGYRSYGHYRPVYKYRAVPYYRPAVVVAPQPYWHSHFYGGRYVRCNVYNGAHYYGPYYPPAGFHIGISIFR